VTGDEYGDDMEMTPWVFEHGKHLPAVLVAECAAPDASLFRLVLPAKGWVRAKVGTRPPTLPEWWADFRTATQYLTITEGNGVLFYTGALDGLPERWAYSAKELGWCVVYLVIGRLAEHGDPISNLRELHDAATAGRVFATRVRITVNEM
jgi:hypothetical protein